MYVVVFVVIRVVRINEVLSNSTSASDSSACSQGLLDAELRCRLVLFPGGVGPVEA